MHGFALEHKDADICLQVPGGDIKTAFTGGQGRIPFNDG